MDRTGFNSGAQFHNMYIMPQIFYAVDKAKGSEAAWNAVKINGAADGAAAVAGAIPYAAAYVATVGIATVGAEVGREIVDEAVDQTFEAATGIPAPITSIVDVGQKLVKEGAQRLFNRLLKNPGFREENARRD